MVFSAILKHFLGYLQEIPWEHWVMMCLLALALTLTLLRKNYSVYSKIVFGVMAFLCFLLLDVSVVIRCMDRSSISLSFDFVSEYNRLFHGNKWAWTHFLSNVLAFIPLGLFLSEFLASAKRFSTGRRLWLATLAGFGLSLCIECLQLLLRVGFFELTDLVMNTLGAFVGAGVAALFRRFLHSLTLGRNDNKEIPSHCSE